MGMIVGMAVIVEMLVGMLVLVAVGMGMLMAVGMGMGDTVMGVLVGMLMGMGMVMSTDMVVMQMHIGNLPVKVYFVPTLYSIPRRSVKTFIFFGRTPRGGLRQAPF